MLNLDLSLIQYIRHRTHDFQILMWIFTSSQVTDTDMWTPELTFCGWEYSCNGAVLSLMSPLIFKLTPVSQVIWANTPFQSWLCQLLEVACSWWWRNCEKPFDDSQHDYVISAYPYAVDWFQLDLYQNWTKYVLRHFAVCKISFSLMLYFQLLNKDVFF